MRSRKGRAEKRGREGRKREGEEGRGREGEAGREGRRVMVEGHEYRMIDPGGMQPQPGQALSMYCYRCCRWAQ